MAMKNSKVYLTRTVSLCASHRLHTPKLSDEENKKLYSKCNNPNGHGHNYKIKVTVCGQVDEITGMVMDAGVLKVIMNETVMAQMDHKYLDKDVDYFKEHTSTAENIAIYIWKLIEPRLKNEKAQLQKVKVYETDNIQAVYKG